MPFLTALLSTVAIQATYGPAVSPPPPVTARAPDAEPGALIGSEAVLRANGLSDDGLRALRAVPLPSIARGASRAAQCAVDQLSAQDPLPIADLANALHERDATAAAQAEATTRYLLAALSVLQGQDRGVLLRVLGTGTVAVGGAPPSRGGARRPGPPVDPDRGGPGVGRGGPPLGDRRATRGGGASPPLEPLPTMRPPSPCEAMLGD